MAQKKIALLADEYFKRSHPDVLTTSFMKGYERDGRRVPSQVRVYAMMVDHRTDRDISHELAQEYGVKEVSTVEDALLDLSDPKHPKLAVDGVIISHETGRAFYDTAEDGMMLFPKLERVEQCIACFQRAGRVAPIFIDKWLGHDWEESKAVYDLAQQHQVPMMAGSLLPYLPGVPAAEIGPDDRVTRALSIGYSSYQFYGFHAIEALQGMVESRPGGETGVAWVQCLGDEYWTRPDYSEWCGDLVDPLLTLCRPKKKGHPRDVHSGIHALLIQYRDGLKAVVLVLTGYEYHSDFLFAAEIEGRSEFLITRFGRDLPEPYPDFDRLIHLMHEMFLTGQPQIPVERTLLTSGILAAGSRSRMKGGVRLETPELAISYAPPGQ